MFALQFRVGIISNYTENDLAVIIYVNNVNQFFKNPSPVELNIDNCNTSNIFACRRPIYFTSYPGHCVVWCGVVWCGVVWCGVVWCGVVWCGVVWCGVVWCGVVWCGVVWCGVVWCGVVWCGVVWCGVVWCGVVWCGVVWCGVVWCGVVWCGVVWCGVVWCGVASVLVEPAHTEVEAAHTESRICPHDRSNLPTCRVEPAHMVECAHI